MLLFFFPSLIGRSCCALLRLRLLCKICLGIVYFTGSAPRTIASDLPSIVSRLPPTANCISVEELEKQFAANWVAACFCCTVFFVCSQYLDEFFKAFNNVFASSSVVSDLGPQMVYTCRIGFPSALVFMLLNLFINLLHFKNLFILVISLLIWFCSNVSALLCCGTRLFTSGCSSTLPVFLCCRRRTQVYANFSCGGYMTHPSILKPRHSSLSFSALHFLGALHTASCVVDFCVASRFISIVLSTVVFPMQCLKGCF